MESYKILGVDENSSMEEVKRAYEDKVSKFKEDIKDEKRVKAFIKEFDKAYEEIKRERESSTYRTIDNRSSSRQHIENNIDRNTYDDYEEIESRKRRSKKSSSNPSSRRRSNSSGSGSNGKRQSQNSNDSRKTEVKRRKESSSKGSALLLPLKILALPVILVLSIIVFVCNIIRMISWIACKVIIIAAIAASAIHGYQIYIGQAPKYEIFAISGVAFIVSLFLPSILKLVPSTLGVLNKRLKRFVF